MPASIWPVGAVGWWPNACSEGEAPTGASEPVPTSGTAPSLDSSWATGASVCGAAASTEGSAEVRARSDSRATMAHDDTAGSGGDLPRVGPVLAPCWPRVGLALAPRWPRDVLAMSSRSSGDKLARNHRDLRIFTG